MFFWIYELPVEKDNIEEQSENKKIKCQKQFVGQYFLRKEDALVFYQIQAKKWGFSIEKGGL